LCNDHRTIECPACKYSRKAPNANA
jgi:hypothetical protein